MPILSWTVNAIIRRRQFMTDIILCYYWLYVFTTYYVNIVNHEESDLITTRKIFSHYLYVYYI